MSPGNKRCNKCKWPRCSVWDPERNVEIRLLNVHTEQCYPFVRNSKGEYILVGNPGEEFAFQLNGMSEKTKDDGVQAEVFVDGRRLGQKTKKRSLSITYSVIYNESTWVAACHEGDLGYYSLKFHEAGGEESRSNRKMGTMTIKLWSSKRKKKPAEVFETVRWQPSDEEKLSNSKNPGDAPLQSLCIPTKKFWKTSSLFAVRGRQLKTTITAEAPFRSYAKTPFSVFSFRYETAEKLSLNGTLSPNTNPDHRQYFFGTGKDRWDPHKRTIMQGSAVEHVVQYIKSFGSGYHKYSQRFEELKIDGVVLMNDVSKKVLEVDIGVKSRYHLNRMWKMISQLQIRERLRQEKNKRGIDLCNLECDLTAGDIPKWTKRIRLTEVE